MFRITKAEEQAVRLTMRLASAGGQQTLSDLAEAEQLPEPTVAKLLGMLRKGKVVSAVRGRNGGYVLADAPARISTGMIIRSVSNDPSPGFPCGDTGADACPRNSDCGLRPVWQHLEGRLTEVLNNTSVADLLEKEARAASNLQAQWPIAGD
jgi:Rrf2 family protein